MNNVSDAHHLNVDGKYFCTDPDKENGCIQCGLCPGNLPEVFAEDEEGSAYVHTQPNADLEIAVHELIQDCPVGSIQER